MFRKKEELVTHLSQNEKDLILSAYPEGTIIEEAHFFDNYNLPCPIKVKIVIPTGESKFVVLRKKRHGVAKLEAAILPLLSKCGLPVAKVIAGPKHDALVLSLLEGENLQHFSMRSKRHAEKAKELLTESFIRLESVTQKISQDAAELLPRFTLADELDIISGEGPWNGEKVFKEAVDFLFPLLPQISTPLVFTNGDYQPANFLTDGKRITGFVDFEGAQFCDPLLLPCKYITHDLHPLNKAGFIDFYLKKRGYTKHAFSIRLALFCLITLHYEIPVHPTDQGKQEYQKHVLRLLKESLKTIKESGTLHASFE